MTTQPTNDKAQEKKERTMQIAKTIYSQIGLTTKLACGIRETYCGNTEGEDYPYLRMRVGNGSYRQFIKVIYMQDDTYVVELLKMTKDGWVQLEEAEDVYCDQLSEVIYHMVNK